MVNFAIRILTDSIYFVVILVLRFLKNCAKKTILKINQLSCFIDFVTKIVLKLKDCDDHISNYGMARAASNHNGRHADACHDFWKCASGFIFDYVLNLT